MGNHDNKSNRIWLTNLMNLFSLQFTVLLNESQSLQINCHAYHFRDLWVSGNLCFWPSQ